MHGRGSPSRSCGCSTTSVFAAFDLTFAASRSATYVLTDNEKTVTVEHVAGILVRNPQLLG